MGNCQAVDAAALAIQHPDGRVERMYWPVSATAVMKMNPGHYVTLIIPLHIPGEETSENKTVRYTRVKLLRPTERLVLGRAYRLVTTQEVVKVLRAKKHEKMKKNKLESAESQISSCQSEAEVSELEKTSQATRQDGSRRRPGSTNQAAARSKSWHPSLQSISEAAN